MASSRRRVTCWVWRRRPPTDGPPAVATVAGPAASATAPSAAPLSFRIERRPSGPAVLLLAIGSLDGIDIGAPRLDAGRRIDPAVELLKGIMRRRRCTNVAKAALVRGLTPSR